MSRVDIKKRAVFMAVGGVGYAIIELLWRGRTHWSMIIAGGVCFVLFSEIAERLRLRHIILKAAACAVAVTVVELIFGIFFNLILKMGVWDYSRMPLNFLGQICLTYTLLWGGLALVMLPLTEMMNEWLTREASEA